MPKSRPPALEFWFRFLPRGRVSPWHSLVVAAICTGVSALLRFALDPLLGGTVPFITFFPALLVAGVWGGAWAGAGVLVLGSFVAAFFWLKPEWSLDLTITSLAALSLFWILGGVLVLMAATLHTLLRGLAEAEEQANLMAHEMKHRVGNLIGVIQAIARQTARNSATVADFQFQFEERLLALARAQKFAGAESGEPPDLKAFLAAALEPFGRDRFTLSGPPAALQPSLASSFALLLHELGTNAMKYGALSAAGGQVAISWRVENGHVNLQWHESGGPPVTPPTRSGFGSKLLKLAFPPESGQASILYEPAGVRCAITFSEAR
ncbi:MAG: HWE histidine kinase domain-containing protein [Beijerinckiaceae bacterium]|nr:HWE histidine kinase domain-containing protein [Beijerinckiaceae bacterium]